MNFRLRNPLFVFALVFLWRVAVLVFASQPIPANDAFFFDGAAVNSVLHGRFANPSLIYFTPFSATNVFCAYPPVYPLAMRGWMGLAGTGVLAAMWFHLAVFGVYLLVLLAIFRRLQVPAWCINLAGLFLLANTFDDRPDSLAHVFGLIALWLWLRVENLRLGGWLPAAAVTLALWTNPEVGGIYFGMLGLLTLVKVVAGPPKWPVLPLLLLAVLPPLTVFAFKAWQPELWAGFLEHARQTPSLTALRRLSGGDVLKVVRAVPGTLLVVAVLPGYLRRENWQHPLFQVVAVLAVTSLGVAVATLTVFTADWISLARYLQPLTVGIFLAWRFPAWYAAVRSWSRGVAALALLAALRAIGISTWGVACAADVSCPQALQLLRAEVKTLPPGSTVVFSSAYLYEAAKLDRVVAVHDDWLHPIITTVREEVADRQALLDRKPAAMILVQYDYYRHFRPVLQELQRHPELVAIRVTDHARVPPPDAFPAVQRLLQHIAWAPVVVEFKWK